MLFYTREMLQLPPAASPKYLKPSNIKAMIVLTISLFAVI